MMYCKNNHRNQYIALIGIILMILARGFLPTSSLLLISAFCFFGCTLFLVGYGVSRFFALENTNEMYAFSIVSLLKGITTLKNFIQQFVYY